MRLRLVPLLAAMLVSAALPAAPAAQSHALGFRLADLDLAVFAAEAPAPQAPADAHPEPAPLVAPPPLPALAVHPALGLGSPDTTLASAPAADTAGIRPLRLTALVGGSAGAALFVMDHQRRRWWADRSPTFRVQNDWGYVRWADKLGHYYAAALQTRLYRSSLRWAGVPEAQARLWGAVGGFSNMLYYEILDGYGVQWGFSPGDVVFNTLGVFMATAQADDPRLDAVRLKMTYWPSGWEGKNPIDDYAGQTYWLTVTPHALAPEAAQRLLPPWLGLAVGYGARDRDELGFLTSSHVFLGLDIEPAGLPFRGKVWDRLVPWLRHVRLPAPAVRLAPDPVFLPFAF